MPMAWLDHVNIRTANLDAMSEFYEKALGLKRGKRPPFKFGGAWHYCNGRAIVHLVETTRKIKANEAQVEHFALRADGSMKTFQRKLRKMDAPYDVVTLRDINMRQVNVFDPDGNKIEVQFAGTPNDDLEPFQGSKAAQRRKQKGRQFNAAPSLEVAKSKSKTTRTNKNFGAPRPLAKSAKPKTTTAAKAKKSAKPATRKPASRKPTTKAGARKTTRRRKAA